MIKHEMLEPFLAKDDIISIFVEFSNRVEKQIELLQKDIKKLKEENRIMQDVSQAKVVGSDETGTKVNNGNYQA